MVSESEREDFRATIAAGEATRGRRRVRAPPALSISERVAEIAFNMTGHARQIDHGPRTRAVFDEESTYESNFQLRGTNIKRALIHVAQFLHSRNVHLVLVAIGPTSDTLRQPRPYEDRATTDYLIPEIEFFYESQPSRTEGMIRAAVSYAYQKTGVDLNGRSMRHRYGLRNQHTAGGRSQIPTHFMTLHQLLLFAAPGLTVLDGQETPDVNDIYPAWI